MKTIKYNIRMYTPIGVKTGIMFATMNEDKISGTIELLKHTEPFNGSIAENGECEISGRIISLMRAIEYIASGQITPTSVQLLARGERNTFKITGEVIEAEGEKVYE